MFKTRFTQTRGEGERELLRRFEKAIEEERKKLDYLKEALSSANRENNRLYNIFLNDHNKTCQGKQRETATPGKADREGGALHPRNRIIKNTPLRGVF